MDTSPLDISFWTAGADWTSPSKMMTIWPFVDTKSAVAWANAAVPSESSDRFTA